MLAAEHRQRRDPGRIVIETPEDGPGLNADIEPGLRNIHSTNDLHHGNLPCSYDRDLPTVRSFVTTAKIPSSPAVVAKGVSGDIAARFGRWPPAKALSRFHRTFCSMGRYKGERHNERLRPLTRLATASRCRSTLSRLGPVALLVFAAEARSGERRGSGDCWQRQGLVPPAGGSGCDGGPSPHVERD